VDDAAVYLVENSGGSGVFTYLAVLLNQNGEYVNASTTLLGDRVQIKSAAIRNQAIQLEMVIAGEDDAFCCPTQLVSVSYALDDTNTLAETSFEALGRVSLADLFGTSWSLDRLDFETPILSDTEITLTIADDLISGLAGCNAYTAPLNVEGDPTAPGQSLDFGPIALTRRACEQDVMAQEMTYVSALENVVQFSYQAGQLALTYSGEDSFGTLYFNLVDGVR
jgi:heat shock protein HslJ